MSENTEPKPVVVEKVKNPKRVAAGKALAEKNRKYKEHFEKTSSTTTVETATPKSDSDSLGVYCFVGVVVLGAAGLVYYQSRTVTEPEPVFKPEPVPAPAPKPSRLINV